MHEVRLVWLNDFFMRRQSVRKSSFAPERWDGCRDKGGISDRVKISVRRMRRSLLQEMGYTYRLSV